MTSATLVHLTTYCVTTCQRSHTQNQGYSKVVIVYSEVTVESQRINLSKAEHAAG